MRKGGTSELTSLVTREQFQDLKFKPGIATGSDGQPLASLELITLISLEAEGSDTGDNVTIRGVMPAGIAMRHNVRLIAGRWFRQGVNEAVVGKSLSDQYPAARLGRKLRMGRSDWEIVGVMDAAGGAQQSEIWGDVNQVAADWNRVLYMSSALVEAPDAATAKALVNSIGDDTRLDLGAQLETDYFALQTQSAEPIEFTGIFVAIIMAVGSSFAAMNTMYAAVSRRAKEIGTLRVLGFSQAQHPDQLLDRIGATGRAGRGDRRPAGVAGERQEHLDWRQLLAIDLRVSHHAGKHGSGHRFRGRAGQRGRPVPGRGGRTKGDSFRAAGNLKSMDAELKSLQIDRGQRNSGRPSSLAKGWIVAGLLVLILLAGGWYFFFSDKLDAAPVVDVQRVSAMSAASAPEGVVLNAAGYIVAAHRIEVAAKVIGKVKWIGVDKGDHVQEGQVIVRLEDDEYQAQLEQAKGQLANLEAKLAEAMHGSRPEEVAQAQANLESARADMDDAKLSIDRAMKLRKEGLTPQQSVDDAQTRYDGAVHRVNSLQKTYELVKLGPRQEEIDSLRGQVEQAKGAVAYAETTLANTIIRAPVTGTILEREVEKGEFVTTSFVGDRGAKGYVVALADLNDLEVELDIAQNDFAKLHSGQHGTVTTDAFPDRKYDGFIKEISPEANRQKATVQIKVKVTKPDEFLRPEMNASVAFLADAKPEAASGSAAAKPVVMVPAAAVRDNAVFVLLDGKAVRRPVKVGAASSGGVCIEQGLIGGEDLIADPPADLKDGEKVRRKA